MQMLARKKLPSYIFVLDIHVLIILTNYVLLQFNMGVVREYNILYIV